MQLRLAPEERKRLKRERDVFLSKAADLPPEAVARRDAWFGVAPELRAAYEVKEAFHAIYHSTSRSAAERAFVRWRETLPEPVKRDFMQIGYAFSAHRVPILDCGPGGRWSRAAGAYMCRRCWRRSGTSRTTAPPTPARTSSTFRRA